MKYLLMTGLFVLSFGIMSCVGPAGPQGETGMQGNTGNTGYTGKQGSAGVQVTRRNRRPG